MAPRRKETTEEERKIIIKLHNDCKSLSQISKIVQRARSTIQGIIDRYCIRKSNKNKKRTGHPRLISKYTGRYIIRCVKRNPRATVPQLNAFLSRQLNLNVCDSTLRNFLRKHGYHGRVARRKYYVNETNRQKRLAFAKEHANDGMDTWKRVIFTDESKFNIFRSDGRVFVWRTKNTELERKNLLPTVKHGGGSVQVWGCMSALGVGSLHFVDTIMDHKMYIDILKKNLRPSAEKMGLHRDYIFMQDNDPKHTALNTRLWVLYNTPKYLVTPPQSPDINPIEHLRDYLEKKIRSHNITSRQSLKLALLEEWQKIDRNVTSNLVNSMPRRLRAIIASNGNPTKY